jgi:uncharacterized protein YjlB
LWYRFISATCVFDFFPSLKSNIRHYQAGVHRVQRVPATETQGRVHTSTATGTILHLFMGYACLLPAQMTHSFLSFFFVFGKISFAVDQWL